MSAQSREATMKRAFGKRFLLHSSFFFAFLIVAGPAFSDDLVRMSGRDLKPGERKFIEEKVKSLRASDHLRRFGHILDLIRLDSLAVPFLRKEVERGSNPIPVRCAIMTLSEIAPTGLAQYLSGIVKGSKKGRDEKTLAILGLGKVGADREAAALRKLLRKGEDRMIRRSAALALGRMGDEESFKAILSSGRHDREERVAVTLLLAAALAGGDAFSAHAPRLLDEMDSRRRSAVVVGCAFRADPVLKDPLLKHAVRDEECAGALAVCLGRYKGAKVESWLTKTASGLDIPAALNALYSLAASGAHDASGTLLKAFRNAAHDDPRIVHALLAAADAGLGDSFRQPARESLSVASDSVRSAAALALAGLEDRGAIRLVKKQLAGEKSERVVLDLLIAAGLVGIAQDTEEVEHLEQNAQAAAVRELAGLVHKVLVKKVDRTLLQDIYEERLASLSGRWVYRFRDCFMEEVRYGMDLDTILRRVSVDGGTETDDDAGDGQEEGGDESGDEPSDPPSGEIPGPGEGEATAPPAQGGQGNFNQLRRRVIVRGEVVEWDILHWFDELDYFPRELFFTR